MQTIASILGLLLAMALGCSPDSAVEDPATLATGEPPGSANVSPSTASPRLIVLVSIDTLRADHLGLYGSERFTSPILDELAREGVAFDDVSAPAPWTLPSHASMLTGLYPLRHRLMTMEYALPEGMPTLASMLEGLGFETGAIVNAPWLKRDNYQVTRDFERYLSVQNYDYTRRAPSTWVTDQALEWVDEIGERPLFLFVHYYDVHTNYASEPAYERLFVTPYDGPVDGSAWQLLIARMPDAQIELCQREFTAEFCSFGSAEKPRLVDGSVEKIVIDAAGVRHLEELYDAGIRQMDDELGRLVSGLRDRGVLDETLLIITSDHGEEFMDHGSVEHSTATYQESLRVPLVIRGPGIPSGKRISAPVSLVDLTPTILGLAGGKPPPGLDGSDLGPLIHGGSSRFFDQRLLFGEASNNLEHERHAALKGMYPIYWSVRRGPYKLVWESRDDRYWLFDLTADPGEKDDIAAAHPEIFAGLRAELAARQRVYRTDFRVGEPVELDPKEREQLRALGYIQ